MCVECERLFEAYRAVEANYVALLQERERAKKRGIATLVEDLDQLIANATGQRRLAFEAFLEHEATHDALPQEK